MNGTTGNGELNHELESPGFDGNDGLESHMASAEVTNTPRINRLVSCVIIAPLSRCGADRESCSKLHSQVLGL